MHFQFCKNHLFKITSPILNITLLTAKQNVTVEATNPAFITYVHDFIYKRRKHSTKVGVSACKLHLAKKFRKIGCNNRPIKNTLSRCMKQISQLGNVYW